MRKFVPVANDVYIRHALKSTFWFVVKHGDRLSACPSLRGAQSPKIGRIEEEEVSFRRGFLCPRVAEISRGFFLEWREVKCREAMDQALFFLVDS